MNERLADDLIVGTARIAAELGRTRRQVQHAIDQGQIPAFKLFGKWAVRRSTLIKYFESLERSRLAENAA